MTVFGKQKTGFNPGKLGVDPVKISNCVIGIERNTAKNKPCAFDMPVQIIIKELLLV